MTERTHANFILEIQTEELPPKHLQALSQAFHDLFTQALSNKQFSFASSRLFATPRRLSIWVEALAHKQPSQVQQKRGPAKQQAFDAEGRPTKATEGFARSLGVALDALEWLQTDQGEWLSYQQTVPGQPIEAALENILQQVIALLPIAKRMRYGQFDTEFVRPVHGILALYGDRVIPLSVLHCESGRTTVGHRFLSKGPITIPDADQYESLLEAAHVIACPLKRKARLLMLAEEAIKNTHEDATLYVASNDFLNEVNNLVEWPVALLGQFHKEYLRIPKEVLMSSMQDHQRYFQVVDRESNLLPYFVTIANIESKHPKTIVTGNERVLNARLSDAAFFFDQDQKETLESRLPRLAQIVYQEKIGSLYDKSQRMSALAAEIATRIGANSTDAARAGLLAKTDLVSHMVGEFPELQGIMGDYYARHDGESEAIATAIREHYQPRHASDALPQSLLSIAVALADKLDHLVGYFGIGHQPTGDKDPYGLRRAAIGLLRLLIETKQHLDLHKLIECATALYPSQALTKTASAALWAFIQERFRYYLQDRNYSVDLFLATSQNGIIDYYDALLRIDALAAFKAHQAAQTLMAAQKRVQNILAKAKDALPTDMTIDHALFQEPSEQALALTIAEQTAIVEVCCNDRRYKDALQELAKLHLILDEFFDKVMVMADDITIRQNRLSILSALRTLFLQVADLSQLQ